MPTPEEEKIIICGAKINYETAHAVARSANSMLETYDLYVQTVKHSNDDDADYFAGVRERAIKIKDLALEVIASATGGYSIC